MKKTKALSILIIAIMLLVAICPIVSNADTTTTITFKDKQLAENVEKYLKSHPALTEEQRNSVKLNGLNLTLLQSAVDDVKELNAGNNTQTDLHITDLTGLEKFVNLTELGLPNGHFTDFTPILGLTKLEKLQMPSCTKIPSIEPVGKLTSLKSLAIGNCNLKSLKGLEKLTNLEELWINNTFQISASEEKNVITDLSPIRNLTKLKFLNLGQMQAENLNDLKNLTALEQLYVEGGNLKDISVLANMKNLRTFRGDLNSIESIENLSFNNIELFWVPYQKIKKFVKLSDKTGTEVTLDLPQLLTAAVTNGSLIYDKNATLEAKNGTVSSDNKKVTAKISNIKAGSVTVEVANSGMGARESIVTYYEALEVLNVKKEPETENADKVKVTITVNKELDPNKIPQGWKLSDDKKSISKEFDKNGKENVTLTDKDGSTVTQNIEVSNIKDGNEKPNPSNPDLGKLEIKKTEEEQDNGKVKVTLTANKELDPNKIPKGWELSEDGKSISKVMDKGSEEKITIVAKDGTSLDYTVKVGGKDESTEGFKVTGTDNEKQSDGKVKVTIKVNKELDPNKIPEGWKLSDDGKSIWKIMDQGKEEKVTLVAKDGSTIEYTVKAKTYETDDKKDNSQAPTDIPQTGVRNVVIGVVAVIAIVGTVVFVRQRNMLK